MTRHKLFIKAQILKIRGATLFRPQYGRGQHYRWNCVYGYGQLTRVAWTLPLLYNKGKKYQQRHL